MLKKMLYSLLFMSVSGASLGADYLTEREFFYRCYKDLTGKRASYNHPLLLEVKNGSKKGKEACLELIQRAKFKGGAMAPENTDNDAVLVFRNFSALHETFAANRHDETAQQSYDPATPATYLTHALFSSKPVSYIWQTDEILTTVREIHKPSTNYKDEADPKLTSGFLSDRGQLLGIDHFDLTPFTYSNKEYIPAYNFGAGFFGHSTYLHNQLRREDTANLNGASKVPRRWGAEFYREVFCRELPVVRIEDSLSYVDTNSSVGFRNEAACVACHVSMDRVVGVIRNQRSIARRYLNLTSVTKPMETSWAVEADSDYMQRPPTGTLYFRSHDGELIDKKVDNLDDLGDAVAATEDAYICLAKRYYRHFTRFDVDIGDIADPRHHGLSYDAGVHRDIVIDLGRNLKNHQSLTMLISEIMSLDSYRKPGRRP